MNQTDLRHCLSPLFVERYTASTPRTNRTFYVAGLPTLTRSHIFSNEPRLNSAINGRANTKSDIKWIKINRNFVKLLQTEWELPLIVN